MKKKIFLTLFVATLLVLTLMPLTSAWFTRDHARFTYQGLSEIQSPITEMCRGYEDVVMDGNTGNDLAILHYFEDGVTSYITTHTATGMANCDREAGTDVGLKCYCIGAKLHVLQDFNSHSTNGFTTKYLREFVGNNYLWHMIVEKNMEERNDEIYAQSDPLLTAKVDYYDTITLNSLFPELGGDSKYMNLVNQVGDINLENDARIFRTAYVGDSSFFDTVYAEKTTIPTRFVILPIALFLIGLLIVVLMFIFGKTGYKWIAIILGLILLLLGIAIFITFVTGTTWKVISVIITIPPKFGYMKLSDADVQYYDKITQEKTNEYLRTGIFDIQDASGLSYTAKDGTPVTGALTQASKGSNYTIGLFVVLLFVSILTLFFKSIVTKKERKSKFKGLNRTLNVSLLALSLMFLAVLVYLIIRAFIF